MNFREEKDCLELTLSPCTLWRWKVEPDLLVGAGSNPFIPATVRSFLRHQCALCNRLCTEAPLRSLVCAVTRCAPRSWFGCFLHPPTSFSFTSLTSAPFIFLVFQMGSVMAVWYLKRKLHVAFCSFERYFC